jgi:transposase InsO family protein
MALVSLPDGASPVYHSDCGCQYCSHLYVGKLCEQGLAISMTEELHCYENAHTERLNGILKQEYGLGVSLRSKNRRSGRLMRRWFFTTPAALMQPLILKRLKICTVGLHKKLSTYFRT